jgi:hypothetical protein
MHLKYENGEMTAEEDEIGGRKHIGSDKIYRQILFW